MTRMRRTHSRRPGYYGPFAALVLISLLWSSAAGAAPMVFHSEDGNGSDMTPGSPGILSAGTSEPVHLYVVRGSNVSSGTKCNPANDPPGDEICGADVEIQIQGAGYITSFSAGSGVVAHPTIFDSDSRSIRMNVPRAVPVPLNADPFYLGTLRLHTDSTAETYVLVTGVQIVNAARQLESIPQELIARTMIPEPGGLLQLVAGMLALGALHLRRRAREAP